MNHSDSFSQEPKGGSRGAAVILQIPHPLSWHEDSALPPGWRGGTPLCSLKGHRAWVGFLHPQDLGLGSEGHCDWLRVGHITATGQ